jgi:hypothetical protein
MLEYFCKKKLDDIQMKFRSKLEDFSYIKNELQSSMKIVSHYDIVEVGKTLPQLNSITNNIGLPLCSGYDLALVYYENFKEDKLPFLYVNNDKYFIKVIAPSDIELTYGETLEEELDLLTGRKGYEWIKECKEK